MHWRDGQPRGRYLRFQASLDGEQLVIVVADWLQRELAKDPLGCTGRRAKPSQKCWKGSVMARFHDSPGNLDKILRHKCHISSLFSQAPFTSSWVHPIQWMLPDTGDLNLDSIYYAYYFIQNCFPKKCLSQTSWLFCSCEAAKIHFSACGHTPGFVDG